MKIVTVATLAALLSNLVGAAPSPDTKPLQVTLLDDEVEITDNAEITFTGVNVDASFTLSIPIDGSVVQISNTLTVARISAEDSVKCQFYGDNGSVTYLEGAQTVDVGPPQPQISGSCTEL